MHMNETLHDRPSLDRTVRPGDEKPNNKTRPLRVPWVGLPPYALEAATPRLLLLVAFFVATILTSNITAIKIADLGFTYATVAILFYPISFIIADTIAEVWGKHIARRVIWIGLFTNAFVSVLLTVAVLMPPAPFFNEQDAYAQILGGVPRIVLASMSAYTVSQHLDVNIFIHLRQKTRGRHLWLRNNAAILASQLVDTTLFTLIAFYGVYPLYALGEIIITEYSIKSALALFGTPLTYMLVYWARGGMKRAIVPTETSRPS
ncbi:MAG: queuosine precursor transporter [Candidatus Carbobacillus sp.]|nr:queuosine precursor transporter [Candidatus Carbobacillus sp.]